MYFTRITKAEYLNDFKMKVTFNNGEILTADFYDLLFNHNYPVFLPLRDLETFRKFIVTDTIEWQEIGVDIAPETVYDMKIDGESTKVAEPEIKYPSDK